MHLPSAPRRRGAVCQTSVKHRTFLAMVLPARELSGRQPACSIRLRGGRASQLVLQAGLEQSCARVAGPKAGETVNPDIGHPRWHHNGLECTPLVLNSCGESLPASTPVLRFRAWAPAGRASVLRVEKDPSSREAPALAKPRQRTKETRERSLVQVGQRKPWRPSCLRVGEAEAAQH